MKRFFEYWKKGWKFVAMMICFNLLHLVFGLPLAIIAGIADLSDKLLYIIYITLCIIFSPLIGYWILYVFREKR